MQSIGEERIAYTHLFLCLVQYRARGKCPSFCCKDFFVTFFLTVGSCLCLFLTEQLITFPVRAITCNTADSADA